MIGFVPHGYLTLRQALDHVAQSLFGDEWQGTVLTDGERRALVEQAQATKLLRAHSTSRRVTRRGVPSGRPDRQDLEDKAADTPETKAARAKLKRRQMLRNRAMGPLQQALFAGEVSARILSEAGNMSDVPARLWGGADAARVFRTGAAEFSARRGAYDGLSIVAGRVLLDETSVAAWLTPGEPRPAPTAASSTADAPPKMESPNLYKTGLPGRPSIAHLIVKEFERRAANNLVCSTLAAEARHLQAWAAEEHQDAPCPKLTSIENHIRERYRQYTREQALKNGPAK